MSETAQIAKYSVELAKKIFPTFYWEKVGPSDISWICVKEFHNKKDHPADAVYRFTHPYTGKQTYILFDFKSLKDTSIQGSSMGNALRSLSLALDCAMISDDWQGKYLKDDEFDIQGCLFIYNHDNNYKKLLSDQLNTNLTQNLNNWPKLQKYHEIIIVDPYTVVYLYRIYNDLIILREEQNLPNKNLMGFYHPDKHIKHGKLTGNGYYKVPLMPEQLSSDIIIIRYAVDEAGKEGFIIYYRGDGETEDEFIYLIDLLFDYQIISHAKKIHLRLFDSHEYAPINLDKAKESYAQKVSGSRDIAECILERLDILEFELGVISIPNNLETLLGMKE